MVAMDYSVKKQQKKNKTCPEDVEVVVFSQNIYRCLLARTMCTLHAQDQCKCETASTPLLWWNAFSSFLRTVVFEITWHRQLCVSLLAKNTVLMLNRTAASSGHLDNTTQAVWTHVAFLLLFFTWSLGYCSHLLGRDALSTTKTPLFI